MPLARPTCSCEASLQRAVLMGGRRCFSSKGSATSVGKAAERKATEKATEKAADSAPHTFFGKRFRIFRERSEAANVARNAMLEDDLKAHRSRLGSMRAVIRSKEKDISLHAPPAALYDAKAAFFFPEMDPVYDLNGRETRFSAAALFGGRTTLVGCSGSRFGDQMVEGWLQEALRGAAGAAAPAAPAAPAAQVAGSATGAAGAGAAHGADGLQVCWLSLLDGSPLGGAGGFLRRPMLAAMRMGVSRERVQLLSGGLDSFLCRFGDSRREREQMRMENRFLGYVCLVDAKGIVRWHVHGNEPPTEEGAEALREGVRTLVAKSRTR